MAIFGKHPAHLMAGKRPLPTAQMLDMNAAMQEAPQAGGVSVMEAPTKQALPAPLNARLAAISAGMPQQEVMPSQPQGPLGASMRQPFDYDAALSALQGDQKKPKWWAYALAGVGDALARNGGGQGWALPLLLNQRSEQQNRMNLAAAQLAKWKYDDYSRQSEADLRSSAPFTIGRDRVQFNPATGQSNVLYDGPEDFELYAQRLGLEPGTPDYFSAVEDYVLRSSGPSAHSRDMQLDDYRTGNDVEMENLRFGNRQSLEQMRQGNRMEVARTRTTASRARGSKPNSDLPVISSPAEAAKLPSGTRFKTPDGRVKVKP